MVNTNHTQRFCKSWSAPSLRWGPGLALVQLWGQMPTPEHFYTCLAPREGQNNAEVDIYAYFELQTSWRRTSLFLFFVCWGNAHYNFNTRDTREMIYSSLLSRVVLCNFEHTHQNSSAPLILRPSRHSNELIWLIRDGIRLFQRALHWLKMCFKIQRT
jgi:hypothetical protein